MEKAETFEIAAYGLNLTVTPYKLDNGEVFSIGFSDGRPPLAVTRTFTGSKVSTILFWQSIPEGRKKEAQLFGAKIDEYLKNKDL